MDRFADRRRELAESALVTLAELGYARTSLREIAANSDFSHGVLHYYFADKDELIAYCVNHFKSQGVRRYDVVVETSSSAEALLDGFVDRLGETIRAEAPMHRLWYDLRAQSMFEESLRETVVTVDRALEDTVWRVLSRYAELLGADPRTTPPVAYALVDGLFQQALLGYLSGHEEAVGSLQEQVRAGLAQLVGPTASAGSTAGSAA